MNIKHSLILLVALFVSCFKAWSFKPVDSLAIYLNKGYYYYDNNNYVESVRQARSLLHKAYKLSDTAYIAEAYYLLGLNDETIEQFESAKEKYNKALELALKRKDSLFVLDIYNELGNIASLHDKNYKLAEEYYLKGLYLEDKIAPNDKIQFIINLCWDYLELSQTNKVTPYLKDIEGYLDNAAKSNVEVDLGSKINVFYILGKYYGETGLFVKGHSYLATAIDLATTNKMYEHLSGAYKADANLYFKEGKANKAYEQLQNYITAYKNFSDVSVLKKLKVEEVKYNIQEYERKLKNAEKDKEIADTLAASKSELNTIYLIVSIVLLVLLAFIFKENLDKKKLIKNLHKNNIALKEAKKQAAMAAEVKSNFVSNISHELRTPLHGVIGITSLLLSEAEISDKNKKLLQSLKFSGDYLLGLINNVLLLSKIDNDKIKILPKPFKLDVFLEHIKHSLEYSALKNKVNITFTKEDAIPNTIILDDSILSEILINLLENAVKFSKNGNVNLLLKRIEGTVADNQIWIRFLVKDDGQGIPQEQRESIFQKFSQISSNQSIMEGAGLGLSIVKSLLLQMGSDICLDSEEGEGSTFYFDLLAEIPVTNAAANTEKAEGMNGNTYGNKKILLVEDNEINKLVIEKFLSPFNVNLEMVSDGISGFEALKNGVYDLALLDINIPGLDGYEITRRVREFNKHLPIVAVTASELSEIEEVAYKSGMNDILIKPFNKERLAEILAKYLN